MKFGDWVLIKFLDYDDGSSAHIYKHPDGREAIVGPGRYCSDPDLGWLMQKFARREKKQSQINLILSIILNGPLLLVAIQAISESSWGGLLATAGYGMCSCSTFGGWNSLLIDPFDKNLKSRLELLIICISFFTIGVLFISLSSFKQLIIINVPVPLIAISLFVGLFGSIKLRCNNRVTEPGLNLFLAQ